MKITFKKGLLAAIAALTVCSARADEGMWLLQLMKQQNSIDMMKKQGLKLEADDLYNPNGVSLKDAVGIFGGGCTGEIISPEGLILTNHHCGYGAIQQHSSVEHDYLTDGFWAMNRSEELPTPGLKFRFVHRIVDITDLVNAKVKAGEVTEVDALTAPFLGKLAKEELELGYRTSVIAKKGYIVLEAVLELQKGEKEKIQAVMDDLKERRVTKQPLEYPSAGSTFKRPEGYFAGKLIQDAGLRGFQVGGAQVSEKHCGFVINKDQATASDVMNLMNQVSDKVYEEFGVRLQPEVKRLGEF